MFGLFKKKTPPKAQPAPQDPLFKDLAARYEPEERTILAVTGPGGFGASKAGESGLWMASMGLTAWMEEDSPHIHQGDFQLVCPADDTLLGYLRQRLRGDFLLKFRARVALDGSSLWLADLPEPGFDPDLKAILDRQKQPQTTYAEGLGTFTLDRRVNWFETEVDWLGRAVSLSYDKGTDQEMKGAQDTARALLADSAGWDQRVRTCAAHRLLDLANAWAADGSEEGEAPEEIDREAFLARLEPDAIQVDHQGGFTFWFGDGEMFWGHSIRVSGTLAGGPDDAQMEG